MKGLSTGPAILVGHHTGALVVLEAAVANPEIASMCMLSSAPLMSPSQREKALSRPSVGAMEEQPDGGHLASLWQARQAFYPPNRPDLLRRFMIDALRLGADIEEGHRAVYRYPLDRRLPALSVPTGLIAAKADPFAYPMLEAWRKALPNAPVEVIEAGMVPLPDQLPSEFAQAITQIVATLNARS